jgi:hypothetical protein
VHGVLLHRDAQRCSTVGPDGLVALALHPLKTAGVTPMQGADKGGQRDMCGEVRV